jgi:hypothetical protein
VLYDIFCLLGLFLKPSSLTRASYFNWLLFSSSKRILEFIKKEF